MARKKKLKPPHKNKVTKKSAAKNLNTLDTLEILKRSFPRKLGYTKAKRFSDKYYVFDLFSLSYNGKLQENGCIVLETPITIPKTKRPKIKILNFSWCRVLWWKQWSRWILFDKKSYETKMSKFLRRQFTDGNLQVFLKKIEFLWDTNTFIIKVVDASTGNFSYTNPKTLHEESVKRKTTKTLLNAIDIFTPDEKLNFILRDKELLSKNKKALKKEVENA